MAQGLAMVSVWGSSSSLRKLVLRHATEFLVLWWLGTTNTPPAHMTSSGSCKIGCSPYSLLPTAHMIYLEAATLCILLAAVNATGPAERNCCGFGA